MTNQNHSRKLGASQHVGCFPALFLLAGLLTANAQTGAIFTSLYSFTGINDGADPQAALVQGSDSNFYGTTSLGGTNNLGTVFKITTTGVLTNLYSFNSGNDGGFPYSGLVQGSDGDFYGTTSAGGTNGGNGTVFKITSAGALTSLYSFTGGPDGGTPWAGLVQGSDGSFYGTTELGGTNNLGTVFQISTNGALTSLYSFTGASDGAYPLASLVQGGDGNFYGTTAGHGPYSYPCTVFKITSTGALTSLYSFSAPWVETPWGLVQGNDGNFYGTTANGGTDLNIAFGYGTVFKMATNGTLTNLYYFNGGNGGAYPHSGLMLASDGNFYGTTEAGGNTNLNHGSGYGTVFTMAASGALSSLYSFGGTNDGANPYGELVQGSDGNFYGTTQYGGTDNLGTVFRLTILPVFQAVTLTNGARTLTWSVETGGTYQLQYRRDWTSANWNNLNSPVIATGATLSFTDSSVIDPWRVYRVKLLP